MIKQYRVKINDRNFIVKAENQRQAILKVKAVIRDNIGIPSWFLQKSLTKDQLNAIKFETLQKVSETDKAVKVRWNTDYGSIQLWVPKSILISEEQAKTEARQEADRLLKKFSEGSERYEKMINFAKQHGLPVRNKMRKETVLSMIEKAGLKYDYYK